ncbi:T9SS type A sorting domain-containing protein [Hymenobacter chitinivorans]|uniref:Putative secreted protein (Por secretion system target) n=1 Tax=Hymenobacter chitinivorans DSM 11115 TaxID=1121954 RepID=A0A2M9ARU6_9BACT|nr:T9SS type A sorting domain-containing protein [Hymenobacter chitinivorans]PJJ48408.1 putative secreted protein (Por secretion system target) [Hymenobacter chitinivorans DSM 11115]
MKTVVVTLSLGIGMLLGLGTAQAQTKPAAKAPAPAAKAAAATKPAASAVVAQEKPAPPDLITSKMEVAAPSTDAIKVRVDTNPLTKRLIVHTNASGPTRVEVNDASGRPVITRDLLVGDEAITLDVSRLPAGSYIVQCTSGARSGMRRVMVGQ